LIDPATMTNAMNGDRAAFAEVVQTCGARLTRFAAGMIGDRETARDIVQDVFVKLWTSKGGYRPTASVDAFLLKIVRNACVDHLRARQPWINLDEEDVPSSMSCELEIVGKALHEAIEQALLLLPEPQRVVFVLSEYEGLKYQEIARILGCPHGTVASRKYAAMESLRRLLAPWMEGDTNDHM